MFILLSVRYFISLMEMLSILISMVESVFVIDKVIKLDLSPLRDNLLAESHAETFLSSRLAMDARSFALIWEKKVLVSSAKKIEVKNSGARG